MRSSLVFALVYVVFIVASAVVSLAQAQRPAAVPQADFSENRSSSRPPPFSAETFCRPPLKYAAGACVAACPGGYEDRGRVCNYRSN